LDFKKPTMPKINDIFNPIIGAIFGIIAWTIAFLSLTIAIILHIKVDPSYGPLSNHLSDLTTGYNLSKMILSIGLILLVIFFIPFYISLGIFLFKKNKNISLIKIALIASITSYLSLIIIVAFPLDPQNYFFCMMHTILGSIYFLFGTVAFILFGIIELLNPKISNFNAIISVITGLLYCNYLIFSAISLFEWIAVAGALIWTISHIIFLLNK